jgi:hypothetical protein
VETFLEDRINIPNNLGSVVNDLISLTNKIYPNIYQLEENGESCAIVSSTNDTNSGINLYVLEKFPKAVVKYVLVRSR